MFITNNCHSLPFCWKHFKLKVPDNQQASKPATNNNRTIIIQNCCCHFNFILFLLLVFPLAEWFTFHLPHSNWIEENQSYLPRTLCAPGQTQYPMVVSYGNALMFRYKINLFDCIIVALLNRFSLHFLRNLKLFLNANREASDEQLFQAMYIYHIQTTNIK